MLTKTKVLLGSLVSVVGSALLYGLCSAQVTTTWSVASTTQLGQNAESQASGNAFAMIWLITAITLGLAAFFFALRWLWHRISGKH